MAAVAAPTWLRLLELWDIRAERACPWVRAWGERVVEVVEVELVGGTVDDGVLKLGVVADGSAVGEECVANAAMTTATTATATATMAMSRLLLCGCPSCAVSRSAGGGNVAVPVGSCPTARSVVGVPVGSARSTAVVGGTTGTAAMVGVPEGSPMDRPHSRQKRALATLSCPTGHGLIKADPQVGQNLAVKSGTGSG